MIPGLDGPFAPFSTTSTTKIQVMRVRMRAYTHVHTHTRAPSSKMLVGMVGSPFEGPAAPEIRGFPPTTNEIPSGRPAPASPARIPAENPGITPKSGLVAALPLTDAVNGRTPREAWNRLPGDGSGERGAEGGWRLAG